MEIFKLFGTVMVDNTKANQSISKTGKNAEGLMGKVGKGLKVVGGIGVGVAAAVGAGAVAVGKMAMDFEQSFAKVTTLLDKNTTDFDKYKQEIMTASKDSGIAVGEFSEAVYGSISAGVDSSKAIQFTTDAMKLAKGGFTDGAKAVDVLTTALNGYKLDASETTKVSDLLITTQNLGKTTVDELASSMGKVIPIASAANFGIEELSASYATLTKNGIATAESGTYMKSMLNELTKKGSKTDLALRELTGQGFAQLKEGGTSTTDILQMLSDKASSSGMSLKDLFGSVEAGTAAMVLMNQGGAEYNDILNQMGNSAGATEEAFNKMADTSKAKFEKLMNALKVTGIELGEKLLPIANVLMDWVINNMPAIQAIIEKSFEVIGKVVGSTVQIIQWLIDAFGKLFESGKDTGDGLTNIWTNIKEMFSEVFSNISDLCVAFVHYFQQVWEVWGETITSLVSGVWEAIKIVFDTGFKVLNDLLKIFTAMFNGDWEGLWNGVRDLVIHIWEGISGLIDNYFNTIYNIILSIGKQVKIAWDEIWNGISKFCSDTWNNIKKGVSDGVTNVWKSTKDMAIKVVESLKDLPKEGLRIATDFVNGFIKGIGNMVSSAVSSVKGFASSCVGAAKDFLGIHSPSRVMMEIGAYTAEGMALGIKNNTDKVTKAVKGMTSFKDDDYSFDGNIKGSDEGNKINKPTKIVFNINNPVIRDDRDIYGLSREIQRTIDNNSRALGLV